MDEKNSFWLSCQSKKKKKGRKEGGRGGGGRKLLAIHSTLLALHHLHWKVASCHHRSPSLSSSFLFSSPPLFPSSHSSLRWIEALGKVMLWDFHMTRVYVKWWCTTSFVLQWHVFLFSFFLPKALNWGSNVIIFLFSFYQIPARSVNHSGAHAHAIKYLNHWNWEKGPRTKI